MSEPHHDVLQEFARTAERHPDRTALVHDGRTLTVAELAALVRATARRLGPDPGAVGVLASRTPETVAALLGTLAAGGAYVPVDPAHPRARRRAVLAAAGCRTLIASGPDRWAPEGVRVIEPPDRGVPGDGPAWEPAAVAGDAPAYILFTSGSTGAPKPVVTPRRAISAVTGALRELFGITPADRVLQFASLNWDTCLEEILPALTAGAALVFHDGARSGSFRRMLRAVADERVTVLDLPTAFWHELVRHLADERAAPPPCVRLVIIGGEAVSPPRLADWRALDTAGIRLLNTYGCTETTLITHAIDLHGPLAEGETGAPIGRPLPHVVQRVTGEGELLVGGPSLALGYRGLPEETAARFVTPEPGAGRYFRTGDRVGVREGGALVHEGRLDHELKIRGIRVDPAEVEAHIAGHPGVGAVAVAGVTVADRTTLAAYVVPRPEHGEGLAAEVREYLRDRVPGHLVPGRITVVPELAYTTSGKVDRAGSHRRYTTN
ncbi:acyl-CoA synthetase [Nonomuraea sp. WAC 01424]|uniref:amino acid adenylation domain-containing protein n=1 Tax=Nonomuraea sp. WAC 01424 TaxID=2203200 RepID=UPI000F79486F|nr:amino acid adenylation domain-containing protein [Nonomuraea sp. WAC 01424]RSN12483.1 acyl-CoA synthetase [Nonomuraea sp. WAC 01424]